MKKLLVVTLLIATPAFAIDDCAGLTELRALYELRSLMMKTYTTSYEIERFIDKRIDQLREPTGDGGYRWVRWTRPNDDPPTQKEGHTVIGIQDRSDFDRWESSGNHAFAIRIVVPRKRSLFNANHAVFVKDVTIDYTVSGVRKSKLEPVNAWMNPDTSRTIDLDAIADRADVVVNASTAEKHAKESLIEVHFRQGVPQDDPANPNYDALQALKRIRSDADAETLDNEIATLEHELFPSVDSFPLLTVVTNLRQADEMIRSEKPEKVEKGEKLLKDTLKRLR
jgi:hypothetical protein